MYLAEIIPISLFSHKKAQRAQSKGTINCAVYASLWLQLSCNLWTIRVVAVAVTIAITVAVAVTVAITIAVAVHRVGATLVTGQCLSQLQVRTKSRQGCCREGL